MTPATLGDLRIGEGGLLRRLERAVHLTRVRSQIVWLIGVTWLPLVFFGLLAEPLTGRTDPLLRSTSMHVRLLVAAPVFLVLDQLFPVVCRRMLQLLVAQGFVPDRTDARFNRMLRTASRLADSSLPEVVLVMVGITLGIVSLTGMVPLGGYARHARLTPAQWWYTMTDVPLFQFLLWRSLWRWAVWMWILVSLSRMDLDLVATHPDRRGGIAFLRLPSVGYCAGLLFAVSSVLCADWGSRFTVEARLSTFKPLLLLFAAVAALIAFGPLLFFWPKLSLLKRDGLFTVGALSAEYGRSFRGVWLGHHEPRQLLGTMDVGALADLNSTFQETIEKIRPLMIDLPHLLVLVIATLAPLVPVMIWSIPREDWLDLLSLLTGGRT
jgi:hypothetical protein